MHLWKLEKLLSLHRCGGKAANLARAREAGIAVPESLVLESDALALFLRETGLGARVEEYLAGMDRAVSRTLDRAWRDLCREVKGSSLPAALEREIAQIATPFLAGLPGPAIVRSSALLEDSKEASFAGAFDSVLDVATVDDLERAIKEVWCSLWSPHAVRYARRMGRQLTAAGMAVLVQRQLQADASGVIYTADPQTGDPFRLKLYGVRGMSLDLMSGTGTGEACTVDWASREILEREAASDGDIGALTPELVEALSGLALSLDDLLNGRLDIEWVLADDTIWIVQARPMTALPEFFPVEMSEEQAKRHWELPNFIVPLRKDCAVNLITPLYDHFSAMEMWYRHYPQDIWFAGINWTGADFNGHRYAILERDRTFIDSFKEDWSRLEPWIDANEPRYRERWDNHVAEVREIAADARDAIARTATAQELIPVWIDVADRVMDLISFGWSAPQSMGWMHEALLHYLMERVSVSYDRAPLLAGSDNSMTYLFARDLQTLVRGASDRDLLSQVEELSTDRLLTGLARTEPGNAFLADLDGLFWEHGKLPLCWRNRPPFWFDRPETHLPIAFAIKETAAGRERDVVDLQRAALARRRAYQAGLKQQIAERDREIAGRFDRVMERARVWTQALNDRHFCQSAWNWEKELVWVIGSRLTDEGLLRRPVDLLALRVDDLEAIGRLADVTRYRERMEERLAKYDRHRRYRPPATLGTTPAQQSDSEVPDEPVPEDVERFEGTGMAGTRTRGRARRVEDLYDPHLLDSLTNEQILVLPGEHAFFYADWHSIFTIVRGVVSPGRPSHHLTQVARECGMPVIGYVQGDLRRIPDGAVLELDPDAGTVHVLQSG